MSFNVFSYMKFIHYFSLLLGVVFLGVSCTEKHNPEAHHTHEHEHDENQILYAKGFSLRNFPDFTLMEVTQPWQGANNVFSYVLAKDLTKIPDSLKKMEAIEIPVKNLVATSTTHLGSIELLGEQTSLIGFPGLNYISSNTFRDLIDSGKILELGSSEQMNTELLLDLNPQVVVASVLDDSNKVLNTVQQSGIRVIYNGDWVEQTALGKAEWIKFFGALYDQQDKAARLFNQIQQDYDQVLSVLEQAKVFPTVYSGAMYQDVWYLPEGQSWAAELFKQAKSDYLWSHSQGTGSLALGFEAVYDKAKDAEFWFNPGTFESLSEIKKASIHYTDFEAFKNAKVYSFALTKGQTGGIVFYELGPTRPDLVLKDLAAIFHPELFPGYQPIFYKLLPYE